MTPGRHGGEDGSLILTEEERRRILARLHSNLAWVGVRIPETVEVGGKRVPLRSTIERLIFAQDLSEEEQSNAQWLMRSLQQRSRELEERLEHDRLSRASADELLERTVGILRAIEELKSLEDPDEWEDRRKAVMDEVDDARRWKRFTKGVYDKDEYR